VIYLKTFITDNSYTSKTIFWPASLPENCNKSSLQTYPILMGGQRKQQTFKEGK
jgi:hypothetical protein